jgi:hypothetical protein
LAAECGVAAVVIVRARAVQSSLSLVSVCAAQKYASSSADPAATSIDDDISLPTAGLAAGTYNLVAKVVWNEHKSGGTHAVNFAPLKLAQAARDSGGGYPIGSFQVS